MKRLAGQHIAPNWITLNWTMHSQTEACITKSSCVDIWEDTA